MATTDQTVPIRDGPWQRMLDAISPTTKQPGAYLLCQNAYPLDPAIGEGIVGRPGVRQLGAIGGSVGARRTQGYYQYTKRDGTEHTIRIVGGRFETFNWSTEVWTNVLTTADLAGAAITLDPNATIAFITFSDKVIISDGVNTAWSWDGTTGAGLTKLTNAPVFYGPLTVYAGRLWGIKAVETSTFVWSEVDDANTGYEVGGYNNAWTLTQTDPNRLYRLIGTNEALYVLRARSGTTISGQVTSSFEAAATRESLSDTIGTMSPFAVVIQDLNILTLDADMHPQLLKPGGVGFAELWTSLRETLRRVPRTPEMLYKCQAVLYTPASLLLISIPQQSATEPNMLLVYDVKGTVPVPVAVWTGWEITAMAMVKDAAKEPRLLHGGTDGYTYLHANPEDEDGPWDDKLAGGTVAVDHRFQTQALGFDVAQEKIFDRIDVSVRASTEMTLEISAETPRGASEPQTIVVDSGYLGWDTGLFDEAVFDDDRTIESHGDVGIDLHARWIKVDFRHRTVGEQFGLVSTTVTAYPTNNDPEVP